MKMEKSQVFTYATNLRTQAIPGWRAWGRGDDIVR
eukprot:SAG11_NODE_18833_length_480_cov_0.934383_1_plen_34_part_10